MKAVYSGTILLNGGKMAQVYYALANSEEEAKTKILQVTKSKGELQDNTVYKVESSIDMLEPDEKALFNGDIAAFQPEPVNLYTENIMNKEALRSKIREIIKEVVTRYDGTGLPSPKEFFDMVNRNTQSGLPTIGTQPITDFIVPGTEKVKNDDDGSELHFAVEFPLPEFRDAVEAEGGINEFLSAFSYNPYDVEPGSTFYRGTFKSKPLSVDKVGTGPKGPTIAFMYRIRMSQDI